MSAAPSAVSAGRILWSRKEFAAMIGISPDTLVKERYWRRYGGKKIGGRIMFSESARRAVAEGRL